MIKTVFDKVKAGTLSMPMDALLAGDCCEQGGFCDCDRYYVQPGTMVAKGLKRAPEEIQAAQGGLSTALELLCNSQVLVVGESMTRAAYRQGMSRVLVA